MEYCPHSVFSKTKVNGVIDEKEVIKVAYDILQALKACHARHISHGDIKPNNIMIDNFGRAKLLDFGMSLSDSNCQHGQNLSDQFWGSFPFAPPEIYLQKTYDRFKADIYAFGVTLFALLTDKVPWKGKTKEEAIENIVNGKYYMRLIQNQLINELISQCIQVDASERPKVDDILKSPLFGTHITPPLYNNQAIRLTKTRSGVNHFKHMRLGTLQYKLPGRNVN